MAQYFPHPRRIVTGHDSEGNAIVLNDSEIPCNPVGPTANFGHLWLSEQFPMSIDGDEDPVKEFSPGLFSDDGIKLRVVDVAPHTETLVHRTVTLDFAILFEGEIDCHLDKGVVVHMKPGDTLVQRGTIHGWTNPGAKPARIYFVIAAAKPAMVAGQELGRKGI